MTEPLVTVVVPVYKVEKQLRRCVDSILNQTYRNLEIILVDDGSPDRCPEICEEYAKKDHRVKVVHKENGGLGFARNTGIEHATGKYICFFDSDDYIEPTTVEECCRMAEKKNADLVCFGHLEETDTGRVMQERLPRTPKEVFTGMEVRQRVIPFSLSHDPAIGEDWNLSLSAWCAMFSMEVIGKNDFRFVSERTCIAEDIYSVLEYYGYCNTVAYIPKAFYHYISNPKSLSKSYRKDRYERLKDFSLQLFELTKKMDMEAVLHDRATAIFLGLTIGAVKQITASEEPLAVKYQGVKTVVRDDYLQSLLKDYNFSGEPMFKKLLLWSMKQKLSAVSYLIFKVKSCLDNR